MFSKMKSKSLALVVMVLAASPAFAQETSVFEQFLDAVGLDGVSAAVIAAGLLLVGIAMAFKGPDLAKRLIRKV